MKPEHGQLFSMIAIIVGGLLTLFGGAGQYYFGQKKDDEKDSLYSASQAKIETQNQQIIESQSKVQSQVGQIEFLKRLIETQQNDLKGYAAGIGSYVGFGFRYGGSPNYLGVEAHNFSPYPALGLGGYWSDLDDNKELTIANLQAREFRIGDLHPQRGTENMLQFDLSEVETFRVNIFLNHNGGGSVCLVRIAKVRDQLIVAFKIETTPRSKENRTFIPENFPKDFPGYTEANPESIF